jgi:hypothetical protein
MEFATTSGLQRKPHPLRPSCPVQSLNDALVTTGCPLEPVTDGERQGLLDVLAEVEDPRDLRGRGVRHPSASNLYLSGCLAVRHRRVEPGRTRVPGRGADLAVQVPRVQVPWPYSWGEGLGAVRRRPFTGPAGRP